MAADSPSLSGATTANTTFAWAIWWRAALHHRLRILEHRIRRRLSAVRPRGNLVALAFDAATGRASGDPLKVADGVSHNVGTGQVAFGVSDEGTLVFGAAAATFGYAYFDRYGRKLRDVTTQHSDGGGRLSRDYLRAAIPEIDPAKASTDIYIVDIATGARSRMTSDPGWEQLPVWSPAGDRVAYRLGSTVYVQQVSGGKPARVAEVESGAVGFVHDWSRDGKYLLLTRSTSTGGELVRLSLTDCRIESIAPSTATASSDARLSSDGRWVAYISGRRVRRKSMCAASLTDESPSESRRPAVMHPSGITTAPSSSIAIAKGWVTACRIRTTGSTVETGARERLFRPTLANSWGATYQHDIDANGRFFVFRVGDDAGSFANSLTVMQNWTKAIAR